MALFDNTTLKTDLRDWLKLVLEAHLLDSPDRAGLPYFKVLYQPPHKCQPAPNPIVYFHRLSIGGDQQQDPCTYFRQVSFRVGVKRRKGDSEDMALDQMDTIRQQFSRQNYFNWLYTFDYKATVYTNTTLRTWGIYDLELTDDIEPVDNDCDCLSVEFGVGFKIGFKKPALNKNVA